MNFFNLYCNYVIVKNKIKIIKNFIVFEGLDGAGTTTQTVLLEKNYQKAGIPCKAGSEPTRGFIGKSIRKVLKGDEKVAPGTLAKLFAADRHEHIYNENSGIDELCKRGFKVISDRYLFSSLAYQSLRYGFKNVLNLNRAFPLPEHLIFLDVPENICQQRLAKRDELEIFEDSSIQKAIIANYQQAFNYYKDSEMKIHTLNGMLPPDELSKIIWRLLQ